jgi:alanine racemase
VTVQLVVRPDRWRDHLREVRESTPGLVPVAKGNGYGFGIDLLAREAARLDVDTLAVGTYPEVPAAAGFPGSVLVLSPWRPFLAAPLDDPRVVHTISRAEDLAAVAARGMRPRVLLELETSMRRHGIPVAQVAQAVPHLDRVDVVGWALHLPLAGDPVGEAQQLASAARAVRDLPVWVSHVPPARLAEVAPQVRLRSGTMLWLGAEGALRVQGHVLDVHPLQRGDRFGYRQRLVRRSGTLLVVSGGTAHGVALTAPTPAVSLRQRGVALVDGGLEAAGKARSPFVVGRAAGPGSPSHRTCSAP